MRKVLVANYYTDGDCSEASYPFAIAELSNKDALIAHCRAELDNRFKNDDPYQIKMVEWPEDKKTDIMLVHDDDLTGGSLDDDAWTVYFEITEVDFI